MNKKLTWFFLFLYFLLLIKLILFKKQIGSVTYFDINSSVTVSESFARANFVPFKSISYLLHQTNIFFIIQNIAGNIAGFVPLGIVAPILLPSAASFVKTTSIAFAVSVLFETIQLLAVLGIFDVDDVLLNTFGGIIGYYIYRSYVRVTKGNMAKP